MSTPTFTESQERVVRHDHGNTVVLAVAGAGKTTVMTHRAARLCREAVVTSSERILMVTFTAKAAKSMKDKLRTLSPGNLVEARTFHSFCFRILREFDERFTVEDCLLGEKEAWKQSNWAESVIKDLRLDKRVVTPRDVISLVDSCKVRGVHPDHIHDADCPLARQLSEHEKDVYSTYTVYQKKARKFDFADMLVYCFDLLRRDEGVRRICQSAYEQVMVDEYQDTDPVQEMVLEMVGGCPRPTLKEEIQVPEKSPTVMVVGDDDQSIYGFRHAEPEFILNFQLKWGADAVFMEENFRSHAQVLGVANKLIGHNTVRHEKVLRPVVGDNGKVVVFADPDESRSVIDEIRRLRQDEELPWGDFTVLYRTNAQSCMFESRLTDEGIPYVCHGQREGFYGMPEVKALVCYLRLFTDPEDFDSLKYVWNRPKRYLRNDMLTKAKEVCEGHDAVAILQEACDQNRRQASRIAQISRAVEKGVADCKAGRRPFDVLEELVIDLDYENWLHEVEKTTNKPFEDLEKLVEQVLEDAHGRDTIPAFLHHVNRVIENAKKQAQGDAVQLMTLHRSKGLEFPVVFLVGMVPDYVPHPRGDVEEERRLAYVGATRAIRRLYVCTQRSNPSPFLKEMGLEIPPMQQEIPVLPGTPQETTEEDVRFVLDDAALGESSEDPLSTDGPKGGLP